MMIMCVYVGMYELITLMNNTWHRKTLGVP